MIRRVVVGCALVAVLAGCRVDATTRVQVREDGSGTVAMTVALDRAAVAAAGDSVEALSASVRLEDLTAAGWRVTPWAATGAGGATISMRKRFATTDALPGVIRELYGARGPIRAVRLLRSESFFGTDFETSAVLDLRVVSAGVAADPALVAALESHGVDPAAFEAALTKDSAGLRVHYDVVLPEAAPQGVAVKPGKRAAFAASSTLDNATRIAAVSVAVILAFGAVTLLIFGELRARRRRSRAGQNAR